MSAAGWLTALGEANAMQRRNDRPTERAASTRPAGGWVKLALPEALVRDLIEQRRLCAADVRCLDPASKERLARLCLEACARCLQPPTVRLDAARNRHGRQRNDR